MTDRRTAGSMRLTLKGGTAAHLTGTTPVANIAENSSDQWYQSEFKGRGHMRRNFFCRAPSLFGLTSTISRFGILHVLSRKDILPRNSINTPIVHA